MAPHYNVINDFGYSEQDWQDGHADDVVSTPYWVIAIVRVGNPLSFDRKTMKSVSDDITAGAMLRAQAPMIITDDCIRLSTHGQKGSHTKSMSAVLKQTDINYLVEIQPCDWVFAWIVNSKATHETLITRLKKGEACNNFDDGLKFVGRVSGIRKSMSVDRSSGFKASSYHLQCTGFQELDTQFFYDYALATKSGDQKIGQWLGRMGIEMVEVFGEAAGDLTHNNINRIIPTLLEIIVGKGPKRNRRRDAAVIAPSGVAGVNITPHPSLDNSAAYSYMIPVLVAQLLGKAEGNTASKVRGYSDILELLIGVQTYSDHSQTAAEPYKAFLPDEERRDGNHIFTKPELLGTFLPQMPEFVNRPLWQILQQFLNPTINEMYTALRVNAEGKIVPTLTVRQIPFTTSAFDPMFHGGLSGSGPGENTAIQHTKFLSVPRWIVPSVLVSSVDIGRSDATHFNFVHIYGHAAALKKGGAPVPMQMVLNPPIRDDVDIIRSGLRAYMGTVECFTSNQVGSTPGVWMALVADFVMGSQFTLNGTIRCQGIQSPICEGDNTEFDGVVYHIEGVQHEVSIDMGGNKNWMTTLQLCNGMRAEVEGENTATKFPIYPGFIQSDNTGFDPGLSLEGMRTAGGASKGAEEEADDLRRTRERNDADRDQESEAFSWGDDVKPDMKPKPKHHRKKR